MTIWIGLAALAALAIAFLFGRSTRPNAGGADSREATATTLRKPVWAVALMLVVLAGTGLHFGLGDMRTDDIALDPQMWDATASSTETDGGPGGLPDVTTMVQRLADRLAATPDDPEGWRMLGWSYLSMDRPAEAEEAYRSAITLRGAVAGYRSGLGEALVRSAAGTVTPAAVAAFRAALERDPREHRARYFLGLAKEQAGDARGAYDAWTALLRDAPADAPWRGEAHASVRAGAAKLGIETASAPEAASTDTAIGRLIDRTNTNPRDHEGWIALARAHHGLGEVGPAHAALDKARAIFAGAPVVLARLDEAAAELGPGASPSQDRRGPTSADIAAAQSMPQDSRQAMIKGMVDGLAERLAADPGDADGWRMLARSYSVLGETAKSLAAYETLLEMRPDDTPALRGYAEALVKTVPADGPYPPRVVAGLSRLLRSVPGDVFAQDQLAEASRRDAK